MSSPPICPYCGEDSKLVNGEAVYPHRRDLYRKRFYLCDACDAYVGCHGTTAAPLGRLANAELRKARMEAHRCFDRIWKSGVASRSQAYAWLAAQLELSTDACHIGMFDEDLCRRTVEAANCFGYPISGERGTRDGT